MAPLLAEQAAAQASAKKLKVKAAPGDLTLPVWQGELEVAAANPDKLRQFEAARDRYVASCEASSHVPTPLHKAFLPPLVPTLRRWLGMPKGTALCKDWTALTPELDAAIMPLLRTKFVVVSPASLRSSLKALAIRAYASSWLDLIRAFDAFSAQWDIAVFAAGHVGVVLSSADLADIFKAACSVIPCLSDVIDGRQDDAKKMSERSEASKVPRVQEVPNDPAVGSCCRILSYTLTQLFAKSLESRHTLSLPFSFVWAGASAARAM
jgi:hypothetical protein